MEGRLERALRKAVAFLESHGYRYALVGGMALPQWGVVRATYDVDIKVLATSIYGNAFGLWRLRIGRVGWLSWTPDVSRTAPPDR